MNTLPAVDIGRIHIHKDVAEAFLVGLWGYASGLDRPPSETPRNNYNSVFSDYNIVPSTHY